LLSGDTPDPSVPARDPDAASRLQLTQALQRAKYAIAWERFWPHLARFLTVAGLFLVVSWVGLWLALPFLARAIGLALFVILALGADMGGVGSSHQGGPLPRRQSYCIIYRNTMFLGLFFPWQPPIRLPLP